MQNRRGAIKHVIIWGTLAIFLSAATYNGLVVRTYTLHSAKLTAPVRLVLLTDLHSCYYGKNQRELIDAIKKAQPDAVLLSGDIADDYMPRKNTLITLRELQGLYPSFYVVGNHEVWSDDFEQIKQSFRDYGVQVLEGERVEFTAKNGQTISIAGVEDPSLGSKTFKAQLNAVFAQPAGQYTVLLSHRPEHFKTYTPFDCELVVCGHAHGGQWRIPGLLNGLIAPNQGFFPKYAGGQYTENGTTMIVSRGLARESTPFVPRVFNPPELVVIDLLPEN